MTHYYTREEFQEVADFVLGQTEHRPKIGIILGSGLNSLAEAVEAAAVFPYKDLTHFPKPTVEGHVGRLILGRLEGLPVMVMQGRTHLYEGYPLQQTMFPIRVMQVMGIKMLITTCAAGSINPKFRPGDLMLIADHISLIGMTGNNPLMGPNDPTLGPRFPDMSKAYDPSLRGIARDVARQYALPMQEGVYAGLSGPSFETPAELRFLRLIGADAVGMSTVSEVTVARHGGIRVMGVAGISNLAILEPTAGQEASHEEVLAAGQQIVPRLTTLIRGVLARLGEA